MKLTVLGSCGGYPRAGGACSGYLLEEGDQKIILDMGTGTLANLQEVCPIEAITAIICTHLHSDHTADLFVLRYALQKKGITLPLYIPENPREEYAQLLTCSAYDVTVIDEDFTLKIGKLDFSFAQMQHPYLDYAVKVTDGGWTFMYTGDTCMCDAFVTFTQGVQVLLCDCNFLEDQTSDKHLSLNQAIAVANEAGVRHLIMTHFDPEISTQRYYQQANDRFKGRVSKAEVLAKINL